MPGAKADRLSSHRAKRSADGAPGFLGAGKSERKRLLPTVCYLAPAGTP
jgi:hypothetical protein